MALRYDREDHEGVSSILEEQDVLYNGLHEL
jgi:hypothetical protein